MSVRPLLSVSAYRDTVEKFIRVFGDFHFGIPHEQVRRSCGIFYVVFGDFFPHDLCASSFFFFFVLRRDG